MSMPRFCPATRVPPQTSGTVGSRVQREDRSSVNENKPRPILRLRAGQALRQNGVPRACFINPFAAERETPSGAKAQVFTFSGRSTILLITSAAPKVPPVHTVSRPLRLGWYPLCPDRRAIPPCTTSVDTQPVEFGIGGVLRSLRGCGLFFDRP